MTTRLFSILRRKPGLIDFITPIQPPSTGVVGYRLKTDTDPGGAFATTILESNLYGFTDSSVAGPQNVIQPGEHVRIIFKPQDHSLTDDFFWLKLVYVDSLNVEMTTPAPSAATLVLPPFTGPEQIGFNATAPNQASIADSLRIDLPRVMDNLRIRNIGSPNLYVAFQEGGGEIIVPSGQESTGYDGLVSSIWIRGNSATTVFSVQCRYANPR